MIQSPVQLHVHPAERRKHRDLTLYSSGVGGCCCCCCCLHTVGGLIGALIGSGPPRQRMSPSGLPVPSPLVLAEFRPQSVAQIRERSPEDSPADTAEERVIGRPSGLDCPPLTGSVVESLVESGGATIEVSSESSLTNRRPELAAVTRKRLSGFSLYWLVLFVLMLLPAVGTAITLILQNPQNVSPGYIIGNVFRASTVALLVSIFLLPAFQMAASLVAALIVLLTPAYGPDMRMRQIGRITRYMVIGTVFGIVLMALVYMRFMKNMK